MLRVTHCKKNQSLPNCASFQHVVLAQGSFEKRPQPLADRGRRAMDVILGSGVSEAHWSREARTNRRTLERW